MGVEKILTELLLDSSIIPILIKGVVMAHGFNPFIPQDHTLQFGNHFLKTPPSHHDHHRHHHHTKASLTPSNYQIAAIPRGGLIDFVTVGLSVVRTS